MSDTKHVVLIHGCWARGDSLAPARAAFEDRGYTVHSPTLRHHELPLQEGAMKIAPLSMRDYTDDLVALVDWIPHPSWWGCRWAVCWRSWSTPASGMPTSSPPARHLRQVSSP